MVKKGTKKDAFYAKKYIGGMMPLPLLLIIIALGLALVWFSRFQKSGKTLITSAGCCCCC
jgi:hypothetical protein